jgi:hypothetical protein
VVQDDFIGGGIFQWYQDLFEHRITRPFP